VELEKLRFWERFPVRLAVLFGGAFLIVLTALTVTTTVLVVNAEMTGLQRRILVMAKITAIGLDADAIAAQAPDQPSALREQVGDVLAHVQSSTPEIDSVYVLLRTDQAGMLRFFVDRSAESRQATPGELYDAREVPTLLEGLERPTVETEPVTDNFGTTLSGYAPLITHDGRSIGLVGVDVEVADIHAMRDSVLRLAAALYVVTALLVAVVAWRASLTLRTPLIRLMASAAAISQGYLGMRIGMLRRDEFGVLANHFDQMAAGLEEREFIRATFGRYMSKDVARALLANRDALQPGGEEREVTILFSDLRGYSTIAEHLTPTQVVTLLNEYLAAMNAAIDAHHGCVIEFLGDAILAVFGAPAPLPGHGEWAVRAALAMGEALAKQNAIWEQSGFARIWTDGGMPSLAQRVGIHTGRVVAGNLGSSERMKYAVIGDAVNVAARLESLNKEMGTEILMSDAVFCELPDELAVHAVSRGTHRVKGRDQEVEVWSMDWRSVAGGPAPRG